MILITGASGNVGREVLKQIVQTEVRVRAAYQSAGRASAPAGVEIALVDFNQPGTLKTALKDVDRVFLVWPPSAELPALERKAVDVIAESGVRQLLKLSAMGGRQATFPRLHAESEDYIRSSGVPYTFLRPNGFMQNIATYNTSTINTQNAFYGTEGDGRVSQIDIRDIAAVASKVLTSDGHLGQTYTLTGPQALSNSDIAGLLSRAIGREIRFVNLPPADYKQALLSAGLPEWNVDALIDLQQFYREDKAAAVTPEVEEILGRKPTSFNQFLQDYRDAFQARGQANV